MEFFLLCWYNLIMSTTMKVAKLPKSGTDKKQPMLTADQFSVKLTNFLTESFGVSYYSLPTGAHIYA
jgi:hypothetical protein